MTTTNQVPHNDNRPPSGPDGEHAGYPHPPAWVAVPVRYPRVSPLAIVALIVSMTGFFPLSLPLGYRARRDIDRAGGEVAGRSLATAAIWLSWSMAGLTVLVLAMLLLVSTMDFGMVCTGVDC